MKQIEDSVIKTNGLTVAGQDIILAAVLMMAAV
jgi:hypothetical protein